MSGRREKTPTGAEGRVLPNKEVLEEEGILWCGFADREDTSRGWRQAMEGDERKSRRCRTLLWAGEQMDNKRDCRCSEESSVCQT
jgi:hypothetical protein